MVEFVIRTVASTGLRVSWHFAKPLRSFLVPILALKVLALAVFRN